MLRFPDSFVPPGSPIRGRTAWVAAVLVAIVMGGSGASALTSVDCDTPDDFCTGDPCETADSIAVTVASCVLDFSPRTLVINGKVFVPNGGALSLTAGAIEVRRTIDGKHTDSSAGDGSDITLIASGDILVRGRIDAAGRNSVGTITLDAGGDIDLEHQLRARVKGSGATAVGGTVSVEADGTLASERRGKVDVRGRRNNTAAGQATLRGANGVTLLGRVEARGNPAGSVAVESAAGSVVLREEIRVEGTPAGQASLDAALDLAFTPPRGRIDADGGLGTISIAAGGTATLRTLTARGDFGLGLQGGTIAVLAGTVNAERLRARGPTGGNIDVESTVGDVNLFRDVDVNGRTVAGTVRVDSAANLLVDDIKADAGDIGGEVRLSAIADATIGISSGSDIEVTGDLAGGVIEATAGGNLTAEGDFTAQVGGCIGLSAGGTLDTSQADFDGPVTASCP